MGDTQKLVQRLFIEATAACGDDPLAIARHVRTRLDELTAEERERFDGVAEAVAAYKHDDRPPSETQ